MILSEEFLSEKIKEGDTAVVDVDDEEQCKFYWVIN